MRRQAIIAILFAAVSIFMCGHWDRATAGSDPARAAEPGEAESNAENCPIPDLNEITSMIAEAYCHPLGGGDIPPFKIPPNRYAELHKFFKESEYSPSRDRSDFTAVATVRVNMEPGRCVPSCVYSSSVKDALHFSCEGLRYERVGARFGRTEALAF